MALPKANLVEWWGHKSDWAWFRGRRGVGGKELETANIDNSMRGCAAQVRREMQL